MCKTVERRHSELRNRISLTVLFVAGVVLVVRLTLWVATP